MTKTDTPRATTDATTDATTAATTAATADTTTADATTQQWQPQQPKPRQTKPPTPARSMRPRGRRRRHDVEDAAARVPLFAELRGAWDRHGRTAREPGFWAVSAYAIGRAAARSSSLPLRALGAAAYGALSTGLRFVSGIELNREATVGSDLHLVHGWNVKVHPSTVLGDRVGLMHDVTLGTTPERPFAPKIGNDVFIGAGARVLGDVTVGDGARIAANSLVLSDVPPGATAIGVPARVLRYNGRSDADRRGRDRRLRVVPVVVDRRGGGDDRRKSMRHPPVSG
jgi:serine O-acetyltransferase